jgi:hypothetical protein
VTGDAPCIGKMQTRVESTVCCRFWQNKGMRRGAREREERNNRWEGTGLSGLGEIRHRCLRGWRSSGG